MKKYVPHILIALLIAGAVFSPFGAERAHAACGIINGLTGSWGECLDGFLVTMSSALLNLVSWILWVAGLVLNFTFNITVVNMAVTVRNISAINIGWTVFRDMANMLFIFVLLYAAIATIVNASTHQLQQVIRNLIIAALLINFSLFFTKVVIDASNIVATEFYSNITVSGRALSTAPAGFFNAAANLDGGLSNAFMQPLKLQTIYNSNNGSVVANVLSTASKTLTITVMGSVFMSIVAFIFLVAAALFALRFVVLVFVMVLSPFAVVGFILPGLNGIANQWKNALINQALFAPVYMMLTWLVVKIISDGNFLTGGTGAAPSSSFLEAMAEGAAANAGLFLNFFVIIVFMIASLAIAKGLATRGVPMANQAISMMTGAVGAVALGGAGRAGRRWIGGSAQRLLDDDDRRRALEERASKGGVKGRFAKLQLAGVQKASTASFDARNTWAVGKGATMAGGVELGKSGTVGGYKALKDKQDKKHDERAKRLGEDRELTKDKLMAQMPTRMAQAYAEFGSAQAAYNAAPANTPAQVAAWHRLQEATAARDNMRQLQTDLRTKSAQEVLKQAKDEEKTAKGAYALATTDAARNTARDAMLAAQQRQADLQGERLQKRYSEYLERLGKRRSVLGLMSADRAVKYGLATKRDVQRGAAKRIGKETGTEKMKDVDDAIARASEERRNVTDEISDIRGQIRDRGTAAVATLAEQTQLNTLNARSTELRKIIDEMNRGKRYKIDDPYTFLTNLRRQYPGMP
jgi:hypothetical protein